MTLVIEQFLGKMKGSIKVRRMQEIWLTKEANLILKMQVESIKNLIET